jgi:DNA-binding FadR family transcriptional regulator
VGGAVKPSKSARVVADAIRQMIAAGQLIDGDYLPDDSELMAQFGVSQPTIRQAVRQLQSEGLIDDGPNAQSRTQFREAELHVAQPAALLLDLAGATIADVLTTRAGIEPLCARLLAESRDTDALKEIEKLITKDVPISWRSGHLAQATAKFHRRLVELSGNEPLAIVAGMLDEITVRHTAAAIGRRRGVTQSEYDKLCRSYHRLLELLRAHDGPGAEEHWRLHMDTTRGLLVRGYENTRVRDILR